MTTSVSKEAIEEGLVRQESPEEEIKSSLDQKEEKDESKANKRRYAVTPKPTFANRFIVFWLCSTIVLSTLAYGAVHAWSLALFYSVAALVGLSWLADSWKMQAVRYNDSLLQLPLIGVFVLGMIQLLPLGGALEIPEGVLTVAPTRSLSLDPFATRMALVQLASLFIFFAATLAFIDTHKRVNLFSRMIIIFGFVLAIEGLVQHFSSPTKIYGLRLPFQAEPFGPFINRGHFAACMEMTIALSLGVLLSGGIKRDQRLLYGFMVAVMFVAMVMTGSRASLIVTLAILAFLFAAKALLKRKHHAGEYEDDEEEVYESPRAKIRKAVAALVLSAVAICVLLLVALSLGGSQSIARIFNLTTAEDQIGGGRPHYWSVAIQAIKDRPLMGAGLEGFGVAFTRYDTLGGAVRIERAHNDYLQALTDTGIIGSFFALFFIVMLFRYGFACYKSAHDKFRRGACLGALAGCFAALLHSMFEFPLRTTSNALLFLVLAALATVEVHKEAVKVKRHPVHHEK
jgi:O-antigen ligase